MIHLAGHKFYAWEKTVTGGVSISEALLAKWSFADAHSFFFIFQVEKQCNLG